MARKNKKTTFTPPATQQAEPLPVAMPAPAASWIEWAAIALIILLFVILRVRLVEVPLERDEGEYAYAGQLILEGTPPYKIVYNMKMPGIYAVFAAGMAIFGQTTAGVHATLILANSITIFLVFLLGRLLFDRVAGLVAALTYGFMSASPNVIGLAAHATQFINLFAVAGLIALVQAGRAGSGWVFASAGALLGMAFLMKQHAACLVVFGGLYCLFLDWQVRPFPWAKSLKRAILFAGGSILPFLLTCAALGWAGVLDKFVFWTFVYANHYVNHDRWTRGWRWFLDGVESTVATSIVLWLFAGLGLVVVWMRPDWRRTAQFLTGLFLFAFLAVCPGFYFRTHYFIVMLPVVAILIGGATTWIRDTCLKWNVSPAWAQMVALGVFLIALTMPPQWAQWEYLLVSSTTEACQAIYGYQMNFFLDAHDVARYIEKHTTPADRIVVLGSEPEIYFYARRHSGTGYVYMYPLMEGHPFVRPMQEEMIREMKDSRPTYVVIVSLAASWLRKENSATNLMTWWTSEYSRNYDLVGLIQYSDNGVESSWDQGAVQVKPSTTGAVYVYRRKNSA